jgi:ketosteroid isomerase-like protein
VPVAGAEIVAEFMRGLAGGRPEALHLVAPDVEWHVEDTLPDPEVFHGPDGVDRFFAGLREVWRDLRFETDQCAAVGDRVLVATRQIGKGATSEVLVEQQLFGVFQVADGLIDRFDVYFERDRALAACAAQD